MNSDSHNFLSPHLGRYEKTFKDGVVHVWELYYEGGVGEKSFFRLRWGRAGAKKLQSRTLGMVEAYRMLGKNRGDGFILVDSTTKNWADIQKQIITSAVGEVAVSATKARKM